MNPIIDQAKALLTEIDACRGVKSGATSGALDPLHPICVQAEHLRSVLAQPPATVSGAATIWTVTTEGYSSPMETEVFGSLTEAAEHVRAVMSDVPGGSDERAAAAYADPPDLAAIKEAWAARFDGPCIIEEHTVAVSPAATDFPALSREIAQYLDGVVGVVEANGYERMCLWREGKENGRKWRESLSGYGQTIGKIDGRPVHVSLLVDEVDGHRILFIYPTSQVVDHELIDRWLLATMPGSAKKRDGQYVNKVDAMNFHNVFPYKATRPSDRD
jgi:hypothetical protein